MSRDITIPLDGPAPCNDCDAEMTFTQVGRITHLVVHHNDTCPALRARQAR
ncbi:hypothetical protein OIE13_17000 [Streptosporangium sp. NBC_01810]|uniref:hypothetical protein n=1 Tax=Streptosporangium sp. NBC_01810 TaxID=2975951 RepID=UPI002DD8E8CC|nr:hypothetical protein [Streptosporangium sp. NBC_01810]WSA29425.1 hypothetical protein OIE13_17000 [Streptosporangium sp. NBC_01810]